MRFFVSTILVAVISAGLQLLLPWWSLAIVAFLIGFFAGQKSLAAFISGFIGIAIAWWGYAFIIDFQTHSVLSKKIAELLFIDSSVLLILITGLMGGLAGGFASLSGNLLKKSLS